MVRAFSHVLTPLVSDSMKKYRSGFEQYPVVVNSWVRNLNRVRKQPGHMTYAAYMPHMRRISAAYDILPIYLKNAHEFVLLHLTYAAYVAFAYDIRRICAHMQHRPNCLRLLGTCQHNLGPDPLHGMGRTQEHSPGVIIIIMHLRKSPLKPLIYV